MPEIKTRLTGDNKDLNRKLDQTGKKLKQTGEKGKTSFASLAIGITAAFLAVKKLFNIFGDLVAVYQTQIKAENKVKQGIKSTGMAAGKTADELFRTASALQEMSGYGDEKILNEVTAQLLTFTNIAGTSFDRAQVAALDLATVLDADLKGTTLQLAKALEDPIKGMAALSRSGITFTDQQKKQVKELLKVNDLLGAQDIILKEIEAKYGGQAKVLGDTIGAYGKLGGNIGDVTEKFGKLVFKGLEPAATEFRKFVVGIDDYLALKPSEELGKEKIELNALVGSLANVGDNQERRNGLIRDIEKIYPTFFDNLNLEVLTTEQLKERLDDVNKSMAETIRLKVAREIVDEASNKTQEIQNDIQKREMAFRVKYKEILGDEADMTATIAEQVAQLNKMKDEGNIESGEETRLYYIALGHLDEREKYLKRHKTLLNDVADAQENLNVVQAETGRNLEKEDEEEKKRKKLAKEKEDAEKKLAEDKKKREEKIAADRKKVEEEWQVIINNTTKAFNKQADALERVFGKEFIATTKENIGEIQELYGVFPETFEQIGMSAREMGNEINNALDQTGEKTKEYSDSVSAVADITTAMMSAMTQGAMEGLEGFKEGLKNVLNTIISYLEMKLIAQKVDALIQAGMFPWETPWLMAKLAASVAGMELLKTSIAGFRTGGENIEGAFIAHDRELVTQSGGSSNVHTKRETKELFNMNETNALLREQIKLQKQLLNPKSVIKRGQIYQLYNEEAKNVL